MTKKTLLAVFGLILFAVAVYLVLARSETAVTNEASSAAKPPEVSSEPQPETNLETMNPKNLTKPPLTIDKTKTYEAVLETSKGEITIELFADKTPVTANNFVYLAREGFYDGTIFHRVIDGFMIQGGDPDGDGTGGPGYRFADEPFEGEYTRGTVAMANAGPDTNGSQFFIMHADYALPPAYVIFGQVVEGLEVVDKIAAAETKMSPSGEKSVPVSPVVVESVSISEK